ncbi:unnamed protein product, partial [marine sediment metagenome]
MKSRGIVFYIAGAKINFLIPPAIYSLRRFYNGPICFITDPDFSEKIRLQMDKVPDVFWIEDQMEHSFATSRTDIWCRKAYHHIAQYPFNTNLYYDLDHVWTAPFDYSIFDLIEKHGIVCTSANKEPQQCRRKKRAAEECIGYKLPFFHAINGGCTGAIKNSEQAHQWIDLIEETRQHKTLSRNPEEFA